jgi:hypothetical protein
MRTTLDMLLTLARNLYWRVRDRERPAATVNLTKVEKSSLSEGAA